ncbi:MAG: nitronate monooxygenase [Rhodocyclaceae bacterium]|nr:nitronate monooxygenase [Rhodocyclaceae bacterium]
MRHNPFTSAFGLTYPIIQAPMAGGATTPELVAAVCNAGGMGSFAAAALSPQAILDGVRRIRALTARPFNVNLFAPRALQASAGDLTRAHELLAPFRAELGLPDPCTPDKFCENPADQIAALIECRPALASFTFDVLEADDMACLRRAGLAVMGTATNVAEARAWQDAGADFVCAQGGEAGGHRGTFLGDFDQSCIGLMALVPQVVANVRLPVVAAGGIMDGRGIAAAQVLGACAAQLGTAFLCCDESAISAAWKRGLRAAGDASTRVTRAFSGRHARGVANAFMDALRPHEHELPPYPVHNALTADLRAAAARQDRPEYISLWAGQGVPMLRALPAARLMQLLVEERAAALAQVE